jgi:hypothetical protein
MLGLEDRFHQEALCITVVSPNSQDLTQDASAWLSFDMYDEINGFSDLSFRVGKGALGVTAHDEVGEAAKSLFRGIGMDRRERPGMARVQGIEQRSRLDSAHFAENDPVGSEAESVL